MSKKYTFWTVALVLTSFFSAYGQGLKTQADRAYARLKYATAIELYEEHMKRDSADVQVKKNLADSYRKVNDTKNAERVYRRVVNQNPNDAKSALAFAEMLSQNGKYEEAKTWYGKYQQLNSSDPRGADFAKTYTDLNSLYADSLEYRVYALDINSPQADFSPAYYGKGLVFVSGRRPENGSRRVYAWNNSAFLDLFYADTATMRTRLYQTTTGTDEYTAADSYENRLKLLHTDDSRLTSNDTKTLGYYGNNFPQDTSGASRDRRVVPFDKKLNSKFHEGPVAFSKDGNTVYFTRNNYLGGAEKSREGIIKLKIYTSQRPDSNSAWSRPKEMPFNNRDYSVGHPALAADGNTLYFVSDMPGGSGGTDVYKAARTADGQWGKPENLGKAINTEGNEMFPFVTRTNQLYFASNGHAGLGGLDIFEADLNNPASIENLGFPINSKKDDFGMIADSTGERGYFSSNRQRGAADDDMYMFRRVPAPIKLLAYAYENENPRDTLRNVPIEVYEAGKPDAPLPGKNTNGLYAFSLQPDKLYTVSGKKDTSVVAKDFSTLDRKRGETMTDSLQFITDPNLLAKLQAEKNRLGNDDGPDGRKLAADCEENRKLYALDNVYYDFDKANIRGDARPALASVLKLLRKHTDIEIVVSSYTDARGTNNPYNVALSAKRSDAAYNYLVRNGAAKKRLSKESFSENAPVNGCKDGTACTEVQHQLNRRTEFYVVKNGRNITKECDLINYNLPGRIDPADIRLIYFDVDKSDVRADAVAVLDEMAETLRQNPGYKIGAASFTDSRATDGYNFALSRRRLQASVNYLTGKGIPASRIRIREFYGESHLANDCRDDVNCTEEQHQANRRTEFRLIK